MGCMKAVGAVGGGALGYALAPATGGSSLLLSTALGASAGGMLGSSIDASQAAKEAGKLQAKAAGEATDTQLEMYLKSREDLAPWRAAGERALNPLIEMAEKGPGEFIPEDQPGYKFGYKEFVEKPLLQRASAMGKLRSGEQDKESMLEEIDNMESVSANAKAGLKALVEKNAPAASPKSGLWSKILNFFNGE